jgi:chromosome partitioning protein
MILTVGNVKGGVGKSTLAVNIAIALSLAKHDVLLIDGDEQGTGMAFTELRSLQLGNAGYTAVALQGAAIRTQVRQLAPKYDDIVIDVGGQDNGSLRSALLVSQLNLIPLEPRSFDLWAVDKTALLVKEARETNDNLRAVAFLNKADPQGKDNEEAAAYLKDVEGLEAAPMMIVRRKAFPNAAASGLSVLEFNDPKAKEEFSQLLNFVNVLHSDIGEIAYGNR